MTDRERAIPTLAECRPEVLAFARLMEAQLRQNEHKGGWRHCDPQWLFGRLLEEADEVRQELSEPTQPKCGCREAMCPHVVLWFGPDPKRVGAEAADAANFAMMIADVTGALKQVTTERVLTLEMVEKAADEVWSEFKAREDLSVEARDAGIVALERLEALLRQQMGGGQ